MDHLTLGRELARGHLSGGFTLDQAARINRNSLTGGRLVCPGCGAAMHDVAGRHPVGEVSLIRCGECGRGLVLNRPPTRPTG
jgi:hypothetical protein